MLILLHLVDIVTQRVDVSPDVSSLLPPLDSLDSPPLNKRTRRRLKRWHANRAKKASQRTRAQPLQAFRPPTILEEHDNTVFITSALDADGSLLSHPHPLQSHRLINAKRSSQSPSRIGMRRATLAPSFAPNSPTPPSRHSKRLMDPMYKSPNKLSPLSASTASLMLASFSVQDQMINFPTSTSVTQPKTAFQLSDPFTSPLKPIYDELSAAAPSPPKLKTVIVSTNPSTGVTFACTNSPIVTQARKPRLVGLEGEGSPSPLKMDRTNVEYSNVEAIGGSREETSRGRSHSTPSTSPWRKPEFLDGEWRRVDFIARRRDSDVRVEDEVGEGSVVGKRLDLGFGKGGVGKD